MRTYAQRSQTFPVSLSQIADAHYFVVICMIGTGTDIDGFDEGHLDPTQPFNGFNLILPDGDPCKGQEVYLTDSLEDVWFLVSSLY